MPTHTDEATGKRRTTRWKLQRSQAEATLIDSVPVGHTREVRQLPDSRNESHMTGAYRNSPKK